MNAAIERWESEMKALGVPPEVIEQVKHLDARAGAVMQYVENSDFSYASVAGFAMATGLWGNCKDRVPVEV